MNNINTVSTDNSKLAEYRAHSDRVHININGVAPEAYTCDDCSVRNMCRFVYAPANVNGSCAAEGHVLSCRVPGECTDFALVN